MNLAFANKLPACEPLDNNQPELKLVVVNFIEPNKQQPKFKLVVVNFIEPNKQPELKKQQGPKKQAKAEMADILPEGWERKKLSDLALIDKESLKNSTPPNYQFKYIDISCVSRGVINLPSNYMEFKNSPSRARRVVQNGDILMSTVRPNLQSFAYFDKNNKNYIASTGFAVIRAKKNNSGRFLFYSIFSDGVTNQIDKIIVGSNYPAINSSDVKNLFLITPPLPEQKKIASILSSVDEVIKKTTAQVAKLKDLKTSLMQELLTRGIGHSEFKDSPVGCIPVEWEVGLLSDFSEINPRLKQKSNLTKTTKVSFIKMEDVSTSAKVINKKTKLYYQVSKGFTSFQNNDVLVAKITPCFENGKGGYVENLVNGVGFGSTEFHVIRANKKSYPEFLYHFSTYPSFRMKAESNMTGTAGQRRVPTDFFRTYQVALPPLKEQKEIAKILTSVDQKITTTNQKLSALTHTKKALMQDLLTGKKRVM